MRGYIKLDNKLEISARAIFNEIVPLMGIVLALIHLLPGNLNALSGLE